MTNNNEQQEEQQLAQVTNSYYSQDFELVNEELRRHFQLANREIDNVKDKVNVLVGIVHNDNKDWSVRKICDYIAGKNDDLEEFGFSAKTIYNYLNEENRQLIDSRKNKKQKGTFKESPSLKDFREQKGTIVQNSVTESFVESGFQQTVPEESTRTLSHSTATIEAPEQEEVIYDDPQKIIKQYEDTIIKQKKAYEELEQKYDQVIIPFEAKGLVIAPNGQEISIIEKADPYKKTISFEIDQNEVKKLKRF